MTVCLRRDEAGVKFQCLSVSSEGPLLIERWVLQSLQCGQRKGETIWGDSDHQCPCCIATVTTEEFGGDYSTWWAQPGRCSHAKLLDKHSSKHPLCGTSSVAAQVGILEVLRRGKGVPHHHPLPSAANHQLSEWGN